MYNHAEQGLLSNQFEGMSINSPQRHRAAYDSYRAINPHIAANTSKLASIKLLNDS